MHAHTVTTRMTADSICLLAGVEKENVMAGPSRGPKKQAYEVDFMTWMNHGPITNQRKLDDVLQILA
ncbi:hypothetical protein [Brevibacillus nitrificans]|uniref:hypothetical protein n=1 Tax=Brevibacillus nitrificans TaxID=651560 RepID=UPI00285D16DB|nr:hypothetical protein [Brevibacillus nitrificans]MDR7317389.1 hypothetical protein [Brevibacillus nitrificans]